MTAHLSALHVAGGPAGASVLLALGAFLLTGAALTWRAARTARLRRVLAAALTGPDQGVRLAAVERAGELGLAVTAPVLLRAVRAETDPAVLAAVVATVAARQWEPASTARLVELRLWARAYAADHDEARVVAAGRSSSLERGHRRDDSADARQGEVVVEPDPDPLAPVRVLVTGAGGPAGVAVVTALRARGHHVVAVDADPQAVGLRLADEHAVVARADDPLFVTSLLRAAAAHGVRALVCTVAEEYRALSAAGAHFAEAGVNTLFPAAAAVDVCTDKWQFATTMAAADLPTPATGLGTRRGVPGPWVVKPRHGRGSRDVTLADTPEQVLAAIRSCPEPIVQTRLTGREFTVDALVDRSGAVVGACARWRLETKAGISTKGTTFDDPAVLDTVALVLKATGVVGPANVQGFVSDAGEVLVHEVNPRFSGGLPLTLAAGCDIVEEYLRDVMGRDVRPERLVGRPGVTMLRYFAEVFEG